MATKREFIIRDGKLCDMINNLRHNDIVRVALYSDIMNPVLYFFDMFHVGTNIVSFENFIGRGQVSNQFKEIAYVERIACVDTVQHEILVALILENVEMDNALKTIRKKMEELQKSIGILRAHLSYARES